MRVLLLALFACVGLSQCGRCGNTKCKCQANTACRDYSNFQFPSSNAVGCDHNVGRTNAPSPLFNNRTWAEKSVALEFAFGGGLPGCTNCGVPRAYACGGPVVIGNWTNALTFQDPVPRGKRALAVEVVLVGCFGSAAVPNVVTYSVSVNQAVIGTFQAEPNRVACQCGACDGQLTFCRQHPFTGVPGYKYGGSNSIALTLQTNGICLNKATVVVTYGDLLLSKHIPETQDELGVFLMPLQLVQNQITFQDPLPPKSLLISLDMWYMFGTMCASFGTSSVMMFPQLQRHPVGLMEGQQQLLCLDGCQLGGSEQFMFRFAQTFNSCVVDRPSCSRWMLPNSTRYQVGWPDFVYGGKNVLSVGLGASPPNTQKNIYVIDEVYVAMLYYTPGRGKQRAVAIA